MSGPVFPPSPAPGSNQIGRFQIGVSPIGTIAPFNIWETILSQYSNSPTLDAMITSYAEAMDLTEDFDNFYDMIWNVLTAEGYGLDCWGRIVNVSRTVPVVIVGGPPTFGFNEPGNDWQPWNQAPFFSGSGSSATVTMTDAQFRPVVLAKAATNIWDGSIPGWNSILLGLFSGRGTPHVADNQNMSVTLTFPFALTTLDLGIVQQSGCLPQPAGVAINLSYP